MDGLTGIVDHPFLLLVAIVVAAPVLYQYFKWFFGNAAGLGEDAAQAALPNWFAALCCRYWESQWEALKIGFFVLLASGVVTALYKIGVMIFF